MIRSLGLVIYFFMAQIVSCIGVFTYKSFTDYNWLNRVYDAVLMDGAFSAEYMSLLNEVMYPALMISDIIIILPVLLTSRNKLCRKIRTSRTFYYICLGIVLNFIVSVTVDAIPTKNYDNLMSIILTGSPLLVFLISGIFAPVVEEIVFRYKMMDVLENKYNPSVSLIVSSLLFGISHMNLVQSTYAFILGIVLGKIYQKEKNLLPCIIVHLTINAGSVLFEYSSAAVQVILLSGVFLSGFFLLRKRVCLAE